MSAKLKVSDGDWICANAECENVNFARRANCNKCGAGKNPSAQVIKQTGSEIGKGLASKSKGLFSAEDWQCSKCGNINWARRMTCNVCNATKLKTQENRTGSGGGYMERGTVEYNDRQDSDGEFDEFGRKKKKFRAPEPLLKKDLVQPKPDIQVEEDDEEDDDDDDDDGSFDASKYDLSASEDEEDDKQNRQPVPISKRRHSSSSSSASSSSSSSSSSRSRSRSSSRSVSPKRARK